MTELTLGFLLTSFLAGSLTVLAPCILPLLPVVIAGSASSRKITRPLRIILALGASIFVFTLLLKASTSLINIPEAFWKWLSGGILLGFGILTLLPSLWQKLSGPLKLDKSSHKLLSRGLKQDTPLGDILIGVSLGPVFSSCSPTYSAIVVTVLPASYQTGLIYLSAYIIGLFIPLLLIAIFGQRLAGKLGMLSDPKGWFKRALAILFIVVGLAIISGADKQFETWLVERGIYDGIVELELDLST